MDPDETKLKKSDPRNRGFYRNEHGIWVTKEHSGNHYGETQLDGSFRTNVPYEVPRICQGDWTWDVSRDGAKCFSISYLPACIHFDHGETGEMGEVLCGPSCGEDHEMPTLTGRCTYKRVRGA